MGALMKGIGVEIRANITVFGMREFCSGGEPFGYVWIDCWLWEKCRGALAEGSHLEVLDWLGESIPSPRVLFLPFPAPSLLGPICNTYLAQLVEGGNSGLAHLLPLCKAVFA